MPKHHKKSSSESTEFSHDIQLQLFDGNALPVDGTQFWITLKIVKEGKKISLQLPTINFQTGSTSFPQYGPLPGGSLRTSDGFLPEHLRPSDPVYRSYLGASNNGMSSPFSFTTPPSELPVPPVGYIISITFFGALIIQSAGIFDNIIASGAQILMPTDITYLVEPTIKLCDNFTISTGASDVTQFTGGLYGAAGSAYRDLHVNDAFDDIYAWTWSDNSNIPDKTNNTVNCWVAVAKMKNGKLKLRKPFQLSNLAPGIYSWSSAAAINRMNKKNIVVSYSVINIPTTPYRAVSFDGGKTWPINGPTNIQPTGPSAAGDNRGVSADKFGNIWYGTTNFADATTGIPYDQPTFWISSDGGLTFSVAYAAPEFIDPTDFAWDYPQYCFGGDGQGNYGLWFIADYYPNLSGTDIIPAIGFVPITGLGTYGVGTTQFLYSFLNQQFAPSLTASEDGRVWVQSYVNSIPLIAPLVVRFKSPGPIDQNHAGPWHLTISTIETDSLTPTPTISYPSFGYFNSVQTTIYDDKRQALYSLIDQQAPDYGQNMRIYLTISRDNGQTWTKPFYISNTDFANRGFPSMALDSKTGNLVFGWYDGRNDKTFKSVEYFGVVLLAEQLTKMVEKIPLSNPLYMLPSATTPLPSSSPQGNSKFRGNKIRRRIAERQGKTVLP